MNTANVPVNAERIVDGVAILVGMAVSFAAGKWLFGEDVAAMSGGWRYVAQTTTASLALLLPTFQMIVFVQKFTQKEWVSSIYGIVAGILSVGALLAGMNVGAKLESEKKAESSHAIVRAQAASQLQYERLNATILYATQGCRSPPSKPVE
ncbi:MULTISPECIES: hypothetical protein [Stenotrophomonas]|uniref:hypothetical protein n=1 Tax=Stenotrophomonas TaxID=40323 RepID=UPI002590622F|nr:MULTISPECIES: hypothetical protein [Stenotrophomonas]MCR1005753.1 hypothetical protein [Stenotrophomonas maltophilia]MCR1570560.1 hypothetical protein [Stenotrophomonas sp.]